MLYIKSPAHIQLITGSLYPLTNFTHIPHLLTLTTTNLLCFREFIDKWDYIIFVFLFVAISHSIILSRFIQVIVNGRRGPQAVSQNWMGTQLGFVIGQTFGCAKPLGEVAGWALWLGGAVVYAPWLGRVSGWAPFLREATGYVQQSGRAVCWTLLLVLTPWLGGSIGWAPWLLGVTVQAPWLWGPEFGSTVKPGCWRDCLPQWARGCAPQLADICGHVSWSGNTRGYSQ